MVRSLVFPSTCFFTKLMRKTPDSHLLLGSAHRDAAGPQECAHYRELDDCPECDGGCRAGVLSV